MNNEKALDWVKERLMYIGQYCNLEDEDVKKAIEVLTYIKNLLKDRDEEITELNNLAYEFQERL